MRGAIFTCSVLAGAAVLALTGCTADTPPSSPPSTSPSATAPAAAVLAPDGDATANLPFFAQVADAVVASGQVTGADFTDALATAGFDRAAMQVTADVTPTGLDADSVSFSVLWDGECLVGQYGSAVGGLVTAVAPALDGVCLSGPTVPVG